jgi:GNAT superfamily N-acetyltransferase
MPVELRTLTGDDLDAALPELARLRIEVFRAFPYLYDGDAAYEEGYLRTYAETPGAILVAAIDDTAGVVGAATGLPLAGEPPDVRDAVADAGLDVDATFYFGESVLRESWRGQGLGVRFFEAREAHARALGYGLALFCAVVRPAEHPRKPDEYEPLDGFWRRRGYAPLPRVRTTFSWRDLDEASESPKPMMFWGKPL